MAVIRLVGVYSRSEMSKETQDVHFRLPKTNVVVFLFVLHTSVWIATIVMRTILSNN